MKKIITLCLMTTLFVSTQISAHTIAIGTTNAGAPGSVTVWLASYGPGHGGSVSIQGNITLDGVTQDFGLLTSVLPTGLDAGDNYFYADGGNVADAFSSTANNTGHVDTFWQGATFTGLAAGAYSYAIAGLTNVDWANDNNGVSAWGGNLVIPGSSVSAVPVPAAAWLFGSALLGFVGVSRRKKANAITA